MKSRKKIRASWDEWFILFVHLTAARATCPRYHAGAVIVNEKRIIATGYNGAPHGVEHCDEVGCDVIDNHCVVTTHAEVNAITSAAKLGISLNGATMYVKDMPCLRCTNIIANSGIKSVIMDLNYGYHRNKSTHTKEQKRSKMVFKKAGVKTVVFGGDFLKPMESMLTDFSKQDLACVKQITENLIEQIDKKDCICKNSKGNKKHEKK